MDILPVRASKCLRTPYSKNEIANQSCGIRHGHRGRATKQKKEIADENFETTHLRNGERSKNAAPSQKTYLHIPGHIRTRNVWYNTARQHRKPQGQQTGATVSKHRQTKGGSHESGRFYRSATAATVRHLQPAALLFVVVSRSSMSSSIEQLNHNSTTTTMSMERQASLTVVPILMCVPQLFASSTSGTQLEIIIILGAQTAANLKPLCYCCCRAGIETPVGKLRRVALGHVEATLPRACTNKTRK